MLKFYMVIVYLAMRMVGRKTIGEVFWKLWISILQELSDDDACIAVEGKKDRSVLENLLVPSDAIFIIGDKNLQNAADILASNYSTIYIFLDWDRRGKQKTATIRRFLEERGVRVLNVWTLLRRHLGKYGFKSVGKVEELKKFSILLPRPNTISIKRLKELLSA